MARLEHMDTIDRDLLGEGLLSEQAYTLVDDMSELGSRFGGTESERQAVDYMLARMRDFGFENVHKEQLTYPGWIRGTATLEVTHPVKQILTVIALPHCGTHDIEAEIHHVGIGTPAEWESQRQEVKGKIVVVDAKSPAYFRRGIHRREKYGRAIDAGAIGFIWMRDQGGFLIETGGLWEGAPIPAVGISREEGLALVRLARKSPDGKVRVRLAMTNTIKELPSWNVVGDIPGTSMSDRIVVMGAHYDGHDIAPGSMDDASGAAVTMEAGRLLARHRGKLARTVRMICFPLEEIGLIGSRRYVRAHESELDNFDFMLNLDGAGRGGEKGIMLQSWPELLPVFKTISRGMKWPFVTDIAFAMNSDMYPFSYLGVPSGTMATVGEVRTGRNFGHTIADTMDKVSAHDLRLDSTFVGRLMARVANWDPWPAKRKTTEEIMASIKESGMLEPMKFQGKDIV